MVKLTAVSKVLLFMMVKPVAAMIDPVAMLNELLMLAIMVIGIIFAIRYRQRLFFLLTGDDHVHASVLGTIWFVGCRCFGLCDGSWTKYVSWALCCCWPSMRGLNLKRILGQVLGIVPIPVRISNIVVGDIPAYNTSNFYLSVEVGENPIQITSIAEDASPKVIQFEETIILRIRYAPIEFNVRFCVRELTVFGNKELCECYISPMAMIAWKFADRGPMRFKMEPVERSNDFTFPAWILMEIQSQPEWSAPGSFAIRVTDTQSQTHHDIRDAADFKGQYKLVNSFGVKSEEPDERKIAKLADAKICQGMILKSIFGLKFLILVLFFTSRYYTFTCNGGFLLKEVLRRADIEFPASEKDDVWYSIRCKLPQRNVVNMITKMIEHIFGAGMEQASMHVPGVSNVTGSLKKIPGESVVSSKIPGVTKRNHTKSTFEYDKNSTVPRGVWECSPTDADVARTCFKLPFGSRPVTFPLWLGFTTVSIPCAPQVCELHSFARICDAIVFVVVIVLLCLTAIVKTVFAFIIGRLESEAFEQHH